MANIKDTLLNNEPLLIQYLCCGKVRKNLKEIESFMFMKNFGKVFHAFMGNFSPDKDLNKTLFKSYKLSIKDTFIADELERIIPDDPSEFEDNYQEVLKSINVYIKSRYTHIGLDFTVNKNDSDKGMSYFKKATENNVYENITFQYDEDLIDEFDKQKKITIKSTIPDINNFDDRKGYQSGDLILLGAACLTGDTLIKTTQGDIPIEELAGKQNIGIYSEHNNEIIVTNLKHCWIAKSVNILIEIEDEDGNIVRCTPEHKFGLIDGSYKEAQYLTENDELDVIDIENIKN